MNPINKIQLSDLPWKPFRENANIKNLTDRELKIDMIKLAPNANFDEHSHGTYTRGDLIINEKGSIHATKSGNEGCAILSIKCA